MLSFTNTTHNFKYMTITYVWEKWLKTDVKPAILYVISSSIFLVLKGKKNMLKDLIYTSRVRKIVPNKMMKKSRMWTTETRLTSTTAAGDDISSNTLSCLDIWLFKLTPPWRLSPDDITPWSDVILIWLIALWNLCLCLGLDGSVSVELLLFTLIFVSVEV